MSANHTNGIPWREAFAKAATVAAPLPIETVALREAAGRVLAGPVHSRTDLPGFDTAAMDGYAVCGSGPWQVTGRLLAGAPPWAAPLTPGQAVEIMTGAVVPATATAVIPYEEVVVDGSTVSGVAGRRRHIRRAGEDARRGDPLVPAGRRLTPAVCGLLAQGGVDVVPVHAVPRVRLLVTGDEIVPSGVPGAGSVRDVFGPMITALTATAGGSVTDHRIVRDDPRLLAEAIAATDTEIVAVSGSSSAGRADHLRDVLDGAGARMVVDQVACRPGHPQVLAALAGGRWLVGLPGNPFAGLVAAVTLLRPLLSAMSGALPVTTAAAGLLRLPVLGDVRVTSGITRLVPVVTRGDHAMVVPGSRPASLAGAAAADALAVLEDGWVGGAAADLLSLRGWS
ncbi:molybdopterin molybdotransferase MoeA [Actinoplanes sp. NPDC051494]|uniref:molybdopterin molybdotransferase MoeA n=1 Tax=Actinoplanes sp. NPDC051494 TaxID=3363907 RepID=UPI0037BC92D2